MNTKTLSRMIVFSVFLGFALMPFPSPQAQEGGFSEAFADPSLPGWERSPNATVGNGVLRIESGGFAFRPGQWDNFTLTLKVRHSGEGTLVIAYRPTDAGEYALYLGTNPVTLLRSGSELAKAQIPFPSGAWMQVGITMTGGAHIITLDGKTILTVTDPNPLPAGGLFLRVEGEAVGEFDDVTLTVAGAGSGSEPTSASPASGVAAYQAGSWIRFGGPPGGLGYDIRMRPDNPDIMYVTDAFSGIHKSVDGGHAWFNISDEIVKLHGFANIFCATIDLHDYNSVWAGSQFSGHIYLSADEGKTWEVRDSGIVKGPEWRSVRGITIDPSNPNIVYAGVEVGSSNQQWPSFITTGEVYKSTDRGLTWQRIWQGDNLARYVWVDPRDSNRLYVSTGIFDRTANNYNLEKGDPGGVGVVRSTDGGRTWEALGKDRGLRALYIPSLFMHPENPDILIAAAIDPGSSPDGFRFPAADPTAPGVYVTRNGGDTWEQVLQGEVQAVEIAISNPDIWYAAGENIIWRSDDTGQTWVQYKLESSEMKAGLPIDLQVDPRDPYRIFDNNYGGGNFLSENGGQTWVDASQGYTGAEVGSIVIAPGAGWVVYAGAQPGGFVSRDGGQTWHGFGSVAAANLSYPFGASYGLLGSDIRGNVYHSLDEGVTWTITQILDIPEEFAAGRIPTEIVSLRSMASAPGDPQVVYTGFSHDRCPRGIWFNCATPMPGFFRSSDGGYTWQRAADVPWEGALLRLAVHPTQSQLIYAATGVGLYRSQDGGDTWQFLDALSLSLIAVPQRDLDAPTIAPIVMDVLLDPFDSNIVYAATPFAGVWKSTNGGETWMQASAGMDPNEPVMDLEPDPNRQGVFYAASDASGVFVTTDGGEMWQNIGSDVFFLKRVKTLALNEDGNVLYAGSYLSGVYRLGIPAGEPPMAAPTPISIPTTPAPTVVPPLGAASPTPTSAAKPGICGGAILLPLVFLGLVSLWRQR